MPSSASSPCTKICTIDPQSKLCLGCGRSLAEIGEWSRMNEAERLEIMALLPERLLQHGMNCISPKG